jgi:O-antigen/teichoic acid export membrane protein
MIRLLQSTIFFQAFGYLLQFAAFIIFASLLGSEGQGVLSIFRSAGQIIVALIWLGLPSSIVYFIGKNKSYFKALLHNCLVWFGVVFIILAIIVFVMPIEKIPKLNLIARYIPSLLLFVFLLAFFNLFQGMMLSLRNYLYYNLFSFGLGLIIFLESILMIFSLTYSDRLTIAIWCYLASYSIMFIYGLSVNLLEGYKLTNRVGVELKFMDQFHVGFRGYLSNIAGMLLFRLDLFIIAYFESFKEVGIYSIALFGAEMIIKIPSWSAAILSPMVASSESGHVRRTIYLLYLSIISAAILGISSIFVLKIFQSFIFTIIGKEFVGAGICFIFLLPRVVMQSGVGILAANLAGKGYPWYHPVGCILPLFFVIILDFILIPKFGIIGAAMGGSIAHISAIVVFSIGFYKHNEIDQNIHLKAFWGAVKRQFDGYLKRY